MLVAMPYYGGQPPDLTATYPLPIPAHSPNGQGPVEPTTRDDVTRYLCAAAHLDDDYADGAIREFLTERTRQIPPSPGVDAAAVLTEAVAAQARRTLRDWALILLMAIFALVAPIISPQPGSWWRCRAS